MRFSRVIWEDRSINLPVERGSNIARIDRPKNQTQICRHGPGKERPHAPFGIEKVFNAKTSDDCRDRRDDASDETADEDTCNVWTCRHREAEDAIEEC